MQSLRCIETDEERINEAKEIYRILRKSYFDSVKKAKSNDWHRFVEENGNEDPWGIVYKLISNKITVKEAMVSINRKRGFSGTYIESVKSLTLLPQDDPGSYNDKQLSTISELKTMSMLNNVW